MKKILSDLILIIFLAILLIPLIAQAAVPTVTIVTPNSGRRGSTLSVVITGTNFNTATSINFGGAGVTTSFTHDTTQITANITIASTATLGARDVSVTNPDGTGTKTSGFYVKDLASTCTQYCSNPAIYDSPSSHVCVCNPLTATDFETIVNKIINFLFNIAVVLAPLMIVVGAALFVTSGGNEAQITRAKNIIIWTVVGFMILLLAKGIMSMIEQILGVS